MKTTTSYNIKLDKKMKIERMALELGIKLGRNVKWTEVMGVLVDEFAKDACDVILVREKEKQLKK
ncbi:hypothetical protein [Gallibacterium anatis]|uniref:Uncharacterized protein n=1 Tax=Gallibacterium anatis 4895 TaxID=1396510 RepID=A0A0A2ZYJ2_9PAST|nr:hypothetical protein [Gallibacterium anatis]KGQ59895.1 hypothetical protein IO48_10015 [Gallibacterium anatis 4895]